MTTRFYDELAPYYDLIYAGKDYRSEAAELTRVIREHRRSRGSELLEVACGTGRYLEHLEKRFDCTGLDREPAMLRIARRRLRRSRLVASDMSRFDLGRQFDVVACLFSSISYVHGLRSLRRTVINFSRHLKPGGVLLISPWVTREAFVDGSPHLHVYDGRDVKVARAVVSKRRGRDISHLCFNWMIAERGKPVRHVDDDVHELFMYSRAQMIQATERAGLEATVVKLPARAFGRPQLYVGVKPL